MGVLFLLVGIFGFLITVAQAFLEEYSEGLDSKRLRLKILLGLLFIGMICIPFIHNTYDSVIPKSYVSSIYGDITFSEPMVINYNIYSCSRWWAFKTWTGEQIKDIQITPYEPAD